MSQEVVDATRPLPTMIPSEGYLLLINLFVQKLFEQTLTIPVEYHNEINDAHDNLHGVPYARAEVTGSDWMKLPDMALELAKLVQDSAAYAIKIHALCPPSYFESDSERTFSLTFSYVLEVGQCFGHGRNYGLAQPHESKFTKSVTLRKHKG